MPECKAADVTPEQLEQAARLAERAIGIVMAERPDASTSRVLGDALSLVCLQHVLATTPPDDSVDDTAEAATPDPESGQAD